ncbi:DUF3768 domain-containing protein [uncultured Ruegeria sp.]|uniref:DUF3768 domain-containing protein n=1 Tax=uncultured Ruegeria sp. TaxID=259304 RepID=UPI002628520A|nr:DUF3768 domain-containing protein [uncultured Ruegeria sp.]
MSQPMGRFLGPLEQTKPQADRPGNIGIRITTKETDMNAQVADIAMTQTQVCERLAEQNDAFRKRESAGGSGQWVFTTAIDNEGPTFLQACLEAVQVYDDFTEENDPQGTHEMGFMEVMGKKVWWKIDLYNRTFDGGAENPTSLADTRRVLTILFPSDY